MYYSTNPQKSPTYLQISPNIRKRVYISTKKSYTSAKEPNMSPHEPSISANESHTSAKEPYMFANEPYISTKEPHIFAKEPYISDQEPYISANEPYKSSKVFLFFLFLMQLFMSLKVFLSHIHSLHIHTYIHANSLFLTHAHSQMYK